MARAHTHTYISNYNDLPFILTDMSYLCNSLNDFSYIYVIHFDKILVPLQKYQILECLNSVCRSIMVFQLWAQKCILVRVWIAFQRDWDIFIGTNILWKHCHRILIRRTLLNSTWLTVKLSKFGKRKKVKYMIDFEFHWC